MPANLAEDGPWPEINEMLGSTAQSTLGAIGTRAQFCESPAPVFAGLRSEWRRSGEREREGGGSPIPSRQRADFFRFLVGSEEF